VKRLTLLLVLWFGLCAAAAAASNVWSLHAGMHGRQVKDAQYVMGGHNRFHLTTFHGPVNGYFGPKTEMATKRAKYWLGYHTPTSSSFDSRLYGYLRARPLTRPMQHRRAARRRAYASTHWMLHRGMRGAHVRDAQWLLRGHNRFHLKTYSGPLNGRFTRATAFSSWWVKYWLGYRKPIRPEFGHTLYEYLTGAKKLPADYLQRRVARRKVAGARTLAGFLRYAKTTLGTAYRWGGTDPFHGGADCSGLTQFIYSRYWHISLGRTTYVQVYDGHAISRPSRIGDLIFFGSPPHHVAMYVGHGRMLEDPHTGAVVRIVPVRSYSSVRRILPDSTPYTANASAAGFPMPWWGFALSLLFSLLVGVEAARRLMRRLARKAAHELGELADDLEEALEDEQRP
jgi:cell wall-associated NlpC family hydrolase